MPCKRILEILLFLRSPKGYSVTINLQKKLRRNNQFAEKVAAQSLRSGEKLRRNH